MTACGRGYAFGVVLPLPSAWGFVSFVSFYSRAVPSPDSPLNRFVRKLTTLLRYDGEGTPHDIHKVALTLTTERTTASV